MIKMKPRTEYLVRIVGVLNGDRQETYEEIVALDSARAIDSAQFLAHVRGLTDAQVDVVATGQTWDPAYLEKMCE